MIKLLMPNSKKKTITKSELQKVNPEIKLSKSERTGKDCAKGNAQRNKKEVWFAS